MEITKKQILVFVAALIVGLPLSYYFGGRTFQKGYHVLEEKFAKNEKGYSLRVDSLKNEFKKYKVDSFSITKSVKRDIFISKRGELSDTLIDYLKISRENIKFKPFSNYSKAKGFLYIHKEEIIRYKVLENGIVSEEFVRHNNETRNYHLIGNLTSKNFEIDKLNLTKDGKTFDNSRGSLQITYISPKKESYKRTTGKDRISLDNLKLEVDDVLSKIKEHKILKGTWND